MEMVLKILVPIFAVITLSGKGYRSSYCDKHRWRGFILQMVPVSFWLFYFIVTKQFWIAMITVSNVYFALRGLYNNSSKRKLGEIKCG